MDMGVKITTQVSVTCDICNCIIPVDVHIEEREILPHTQSDWVSAPRVCIVSDWRQGGFFSDNPMYVYCKNCGKKYAAHLKSLKEKQEIEIKNARNVVTKEIKKELK
jgi:hypothetical protein